MLLSLGAVRRLVHAAPAEFHQFGHPMAEVLIGLLASHLLQEGPHDVGKVSCPREAAVGEAHEAPLAVPIDLQEVEEVLQVEFRLLSLEARRLDEVPVVGQRSIDVSLEEPLVVQSWAS